jgi:hypothetical protein
MSLSSFWSSVSDRLRSLRTPHNAARIVTDNVQRGCVFNSHSPLRQESCRSVIWPTLHMYETQFNYSFCTCCRLHVWMV